ncbi:MAG: hypothetical protein NXI32_05075 [bacterium]|nr:hypothetical protein [bacterium]
MDDPPQYATCPKCKQVGSDGDDGWEHLGVAEDKLQCPHCLEEVEIVKLAWCDEPPKQDKQQCVFCQGKGTVE